MAEKDAYVLWYKYLKRSEKYKQCCDENGTGELAGLYVGFGNVHTMSFSVWWKQNKELLFSVEPQFLPYEIKTATQFAYECEDNEDGGLLTVLIGLYASKGEIMAKLEQLVRRAIKKKLKIEHAAEKLKSPARTNLVGRRPTGDSHYFDRYGLEFIPSKDNIQAIDLMLRVYDACKVEDAKPKNDRMKRHEIGYDLKIVITDRETARNAKAKKDAAQALGKGKGKGKGKIIEVSQLSERDSAKMLAIDETKNDSMSKIDRKAAQAERDRVMNSTVCRYNRWAKEMIANTELGFFPKHRRSTVK